ncbi:MAG: IS4 family transposase [Chloroflexota bacterium]|nr:IS4 family transposase [Chloroflexota bacterium]
MTSIATLAPPMRRILTEVAEQAARECGCVKRVRQFSGATLIQTLVLGFLGAPDASLSELCQQAASRGVPISPQGLAQRFTRELAEALKQVLDAVVRETVVGDAVPLALLERFSHVWVLDTTTISLPPELAAVWPGCGGRPGQGEAAVKVGVEIDLVTGCLRGPDLLAGRAPDRTTPLLEHDRSDTPDAPDAPVGLSIRDLGFFSLDQLAAEHEQGGHWVTRLMAGTVVIDAAGVSWTQPELLAAQAGDVVDLPVRIGATAQLEARLLAERVPPAVARERRTRLQREARKKGQRVSTDRLALAEWTVLVTSLSPDELTLDEALALMRARWHIEQLFDLWKTHGGLDRSASAKPWRILAECYAKLIALVIQHWLILHGDWAAPNHSLVKAARVVRRTVPLIAAALDAPQRLVEALQTIQHQLRHAGRLNTRKRHPNLWQRLDDPAATRLS